MFLTLGRRSKAQGDRLDAPTPCAQTRRMSSHETPYLKNIMLEYSGKGYTVFRNNVGALEDKQGRWVKFGVCNPGGSDLIGWRSRIITPDDVGKTIAQFVAIEAKDKARVTPDQRNFLEIVHRSGGIAILRRKGQDAG